MSCQKKIREKGGDNVIAVKENQKGLYENIGVYGIVRPFVRDYMPQIVNNTRSFMVLMMVSTKFSLSSAAPSPWVSGGDPCIPN
jgi:hypothetical protein